MTSIKAPPPCLPTIESAAWLTPEATPHGNTTIMRLDHWCVTARSGPGFQPPERAHVCLMGQVAGHPRYPDGKEITTSLIAGRNGSRIVTKSGNEYELGAAHPTYEATYPDARKRLLTALEPVDDSATRLLAYDI